MSCRIIYANLLFTPGALIVPSSEVGSLPRGNLLQPLPTDVFRFKTGWDFGTGRNDRLDFARSGTPSAAIAGGHYDTGALVSAAIVTAMEAVDAPPAWASDFSVTALSKYTIGNPTLPFDFLFGSGANRAKSAALELGYDEADLLSLSSYTAANQSHQSRRWIDIDLGAAAPFAAAFVVNDNVTPGGSFHLQAAAASLASTALADSAATFATVLAGGPGLRYAFFAPQTFRYLRLVISDPQNVDGFNELGVLCVAPVLDLVGFATDVVDERVALSEISFAIGGAHHTVVRPRRKVWKIRLHNITAAKKAELDAFDDAVSTGGGFFFNFDSNDPANTRYVFLERGVSFVSVESDPVTWQAELELYEVLG